MKTGNLWLEIAALATFAAKPQFSFSTQDHFCNDQQGV